MSKIWICAFSSFRVYEGFLIPAWLVILIAVLWNEHKSAVLCVLTAHITLRMAVNSNVNLRILWTFVGFLLLGWQIRCSWPSSCQVTLTLILCWCQTFFLFFRHHLGYYSWSFAFIYLPTIVTPEETLCKYPSWEFIASFILLHISLALVFIAKLKHMSLFII